MASFTTIKTKGKCEQKLSKQNDDKSIESVKVEVHFTADVKTFFPSRLFREMLKGEFSPHDEWT